VHGQKDRWDLRTWLVVEPTDALSLSWKLQGGHDASDIPLGRSIGLYNRSSPPTLCPALLAGRRDDVNCVNFGSVNRIHRNRGEAPEVISAQAADGSEVFSDPFNEQNNEYVNSVFDVAFALDSVELRSITSYDNFSYGVALDLDGSLGEYGHRISDSDIHVLSQEFRVVSASPSPLQWLAGVSFSAEDFEESRELNGRDNTLVPLYRGHLSYDQDTRASAVFADVEYELSPEWSVATNLRYTDEDKEYRNGDFHLLLANPVYIARNLQADYSLDNNFSGSVGLNWQPVDSLFTYAKVSRGFKSGGFYGGFPFSPVEVTPYLEETINAVEIGFRKTLPDYALQLNGALFHYDYEDVQGYIQMINPLTNTGVDVLANQGDADHDGAELQLQWQPVSRFGVVAGVAWLDAQFISTGTTTSNLLKQQVEISGRRPYAPEWSGNILMNLQQNIGAGLQLDWNLAYDYRSDFAGRQSVPAEAAVNQLPGYGLVTAGVGLRKENAPWSLRLWTRNLTDKSYRTRVKGDGLNSFIEMFGEPRSFGINLQYRL
jgi:iron complex outermembrane receptor protein